MASKTNTLDWEEARAEFFQETFLPSESLNSNTSTALRRQNEAQSVGGGASASFRDASVGTLESHSSRMSNAHLNRSQASTTPADAISPQDDSPPSAQPPSVVGTSSRVNKSRHMRAAVQGLEEEEESDEGEIEVVDFTDGNLLILPSITIFNSSVEVIFIRARLVNPSRKLNARTNCKAFQCPYYLL